ncbi:MAG: hypothetical protein IJR92_00955, partial [Alphaproteobacteria bacterium]|nr:hypothetical protein [Alphaproteobacteria bacterium]
NHCFERAASNNSWISQNQYHLEPTSGTNQKCYSNTRNCNLFTTSGTVSGVEGRALWDNSQRNWQVYITAQDYKCKKTETNKQIRTFNSCGDVNCIATQVSSPTAGARVSTATTEIAYDYIDYYYCTSCINDENMARVPVVVSEQNCIISGRAYCSSNNAKSCRCKPVPRGYYKSPSSCSWDNDTDTLPSCTEPCGPGQTTDGGATSAADCHYTTQTRFCDAHGCFYLSGLSWDATSGYTWGGATSTSSGQ